jgi:hypothetical protein
MQQHASFNSLRPCAFDAHLAAVAHLPRSRIKVDYQENGH